ncbi:alkaline-phosphatase-like protein [Pelagophyceae sp. CCMP2097]|nr:alkaline-phosphatase-like protein [Pelagophyceae sp. CCMP2097]
MARLCLLFACAASAPNVVLFLTDDQDQLLGGSFPIGESGSTPMPKTQELLVQRGMTATRFYAHTPICCPSRAQLLTGRYFHNLRAPPGTPHCMHVDLEKVHDFTFLRRLQEEAGYTTGLFGKYLNTMPSTPPAGIDVFMANDGGNYISPEFTVQGIDFGGFRWPNGTWHGTTEDYTTALVGNLSEAWIRSVAKQGRPFFAYVAPKAAHEPFNPAPWRTLMSVDDVVGAVVGLCEELGLMDNIYFFYTSDHGFQLGEFNIIMDKRQPYEWDTKVHLVVRGPGIPEASHLEALATMVDLAPTFLGLAGLSAGTDGKSLVPLLVSGKSPAATKAHLASMPADYKWRNSVLLEYYFNDPNIKCVSNCTAKYDYPNEDSFCGDLYNGEHCWMCADDCYATESPHNNWIALRSTAQSTFGDTTYVEFETGMQDSQNITFDSPDFFEIETLHSHFKCAGDECP